jgi:uncharacterized metal-binding protein
VASGKIHTKTTFATAGVVLPLAAFYSRDLVITLSMTFGVVCGALISPDLDVSDGFYGLHVLRKIPKYGPKLSKVWQIFWSPYSLCVPHRSIISHSLFLSTALRILYVLCAFLILCALIGVTPPALGRWFLPWFFGLCVSDLVHIIIDRIGTKIAGHI